jgi:hypothetical protein
MNIQIILTNYKNKKYLKIIKKAEIGECQKSFIKYPTGNIYKKL